MKLNGIKDNPGSSKARIRVGRGIGSGKGKQAGRGGKGQTARSGVRIKGFEGGQMPLHRRLPKRGFTPPSPLDVNEVNLGRIQSAIDAGVLDAAKPITVERADRSGRGGARARRREDPRQGRDQGQGGFRSVRRVEERCRGDRKGRRQRQDAQGRSDARGRLDVGAASRGGNSSRSGHMIWTARRIGGHSDCVYSLARRSAAKGGAQSARAIRARKKRSAKTMASAAEQLAANINWSAFAKADELKKRIWFTLGALIVYRLGTYIPCPASTRKRLRTAFLGQKQGVLDMFNMFSGGAVQRMAVFALNIMPYISASIIIQLLSSVLPSLEAIKKEGEAGRKVLNQYTRYLTVVLAVFQAYGIAIGLEGRGGVVADPGLLFRFSTVLTLTGGTMFLVWLGEQITSRGVGNGSSLIIFAGIVARLPVAVAQLFELGRQGSISTGLVLAVVVMVFVVVTFIVFMERAQRRVPITYPRRQVGNKMYEGQSSFLPLKLNTAGVIPPIFASSLLLLPTTVANFAQGSASSGILSMVTTLLGRGGPFYIILYVALIVFFAFFYTATVFNPVDTADNLKKHGGFVPGVRPGERTAQYIDQILTRITVLGAGYLALICILPELLTSYSSIQLYFGGTSLLIVVNVTMDTVAQIHGHLQAHQYEGLIRKAKLRGRKR